MVQARYIAKVLRDGGLAAVMTGLVLTKSLENQAMSAAAAVCAVGAGLSVLIRMPMVIAELNGFRTGIGSLVGAYRGVRA